jgi:hypothetical protein
MEKSEKKVLAPPYLSWKTFSGFIKSFDQGLPPRIDRSAMSRLSGQNQNQMQNALVYLKLTKADGKPEPLLEKIADSSVPEKQAEYQEHLKTMLKGAYPFLFDGTGDFVLDRSTSAQLDERFRAVGVSGDTVMKCEAFFIAAAQEAGIKLSNLILEAKKKGRKTGSVISARRQPTNKRENNNDNEDENTPPPYIPPIQELPAWYTTFKPAFDLLPKFSLSPKPKWTSAEKQVFLDLVSALTNAYTEIEDKKKA